MFQVLQRLSRRNIIVLIAFTISLLMLKLSLTRTQISHFVNQLGSAKSEMECTSTKQMNELFSFPEVNDTELFLNSEVTIGEMIRYNTSRIRRRRVQNVSSEKLLDFFSPALSLEERHIMLILFQTFVRACIKFRLSFFLYGGTLLGSFRHHDIIPWDDDIDVILNTSDRNTLRQALLSTGDRYGSFCPNNYWWKFFWVKANTLSHKPFRWPYIDIFFFAENATHIFDESYDYMNSFSFPKHQVYPLGLHPFAGAMLPVPCNIQSVIDHNYSPSLCTSSSFSHRYEQEVPDYLRTIVSCRKLGHLYPFVTRRDSGDVVDEVLTRDKQLIKTVTLPKKCC